MSLHVALWRRVVRLMIHEPTCITVAPSSKLQIHKPTCSLVAQSGKAYDT